MAAVVAMSSPATTNASADSPPEVVQFHAWTPGDDYWILEGYVVDEEICFITLDGILYDEGFSESDGYFQFVYHFPYGVGGEVTATAYDRSGQSGSASAYILY